MKKVFLSLAVIAALTVVSCKDKAAEAPVEETTVEATTVETAPVATDSTTTTTTTTTTKTPAAPVTEEVKK